MIAVIALALAACAYFVGAFFFEHPRRSDRAYLLAAVNFVGVAVFLGGLEYGWPGLVTLSGLGLMMLPTYAVRRKVRALGGVLRRTARSAF